MSGPSGLVRRVALGRRNEGMQCRVRLTGPLRRVSKSTMMLLTEDRLTTWYRCTMTNSIVITSQSNVSE